MMTFSKTDKSLTVVVMENGRNQVYSTTSANPRWNAILAALKVEDQNTLVDLMSIKNLVERFTESNVEIKDGNVFFKNRQLHGLDVDRLLEYVRDGIPALRLLRFLELKHDNSSYRAVNELYKFLEYREMTLTERGTIIGYKGVSDNYYSIMGNTATIMVTGQTDSSGHILNTVGAEIRCDRASVCDDYRQGCSPGLHIGSLAYAKSWGPRVMIVEFSPADVVSVPDDCECQKLRACAYKVIGEFKGEVVKEVAEVTSPAEDDGPAYEDEDEGCGDPDCPDCHPAPADDTSYDGGYDLGVKDGRAHKARKHYATDLDDSSLTQFDRDYIRGYDNGYRFGRYGK